MNFRDFVIKNGKKTVASLAFHTGILNLYRSRVLRNKAVILAYHRIVDEEDQELTDYSSYGITVTRNNFENQIQYLSTHYNVTRLSELVSFIKNNQPVPDNTCVITFDDGWRDNYTNAYPILKKHGVPATIFLASNFLLNNNWYWEERSKFLLAHLFDCIKHGNIPEQSILKLQQVFEKYDLMDIFSIDSKQLPARLTKTINCIRKNDPEHIDLFMDKLEALTSQPGLEEPRRFLTWDELANMQPVFEIGAHTKSHLDLKFCDDRTASEEILGSRDCISKHLDVTVSLFAYPYGKYNPSIIDLLKNSGFSSAVTLLPGFNATTNELFELKRMDIYNDVASSVPFFECRILRFLNLF